MKIAAGVIIGLSGSFVYCMELTQEERYAVSYMKAYMRGTLEAESSTFTDVRFPDFENKEAKYRMPLAIVELYLDKPSCENPIFKEYLDKFTKFNADEMSVKLRTALQDADIDAINEAAKKLAEANAAVRLKEATQTVASKLQGPQDQRDSCVIL